MAGMQRPYGTCAGKRQGSTPWVTAPCAGLTSWPSLASSMPSSFPSWPLSSATGRTICCMRSSRQRAKILSALRGYKAKHPQQDSLPVAGSLGTPSLSCPSSAARGHAVSRAAPRTLPPALGTCWPPAVSMATSMSTPAPPSHASCQLRIPRCPQAAARGGHPKPASFKNSVQLQFCSKEKTISKFLTDFYIPRSPDLTPPTQTRTQRCPALAAPQPPSCSHFVQLRDPDSMARGPSIQNGAQPLLLHVNSYSLNRVKVT